MKKQKPDIVLEVLKSSEVARNSRKGVVWEVWKRKGLIFTDELGREFISRENFMKSNSESIRRHSQQLQRSDRQLGKWLIQPSKEVAKHREEEAKLKGFNYINGQGTFI